MATQILFVGKIDSRLQRTLARLEAKGYEVTLARNSKGALRIADADPPDIVVIDTTVPRTGAAKLCCKLKRSRPDIPILLLVDDEQPHPEFPHDSTLRKTASFTRLHKAISRLLEEHSDKTLVVGSLILDLTTRTVRSLKGIHRLRPKGARLLETFMRHPGQVLTHEFLMKAVWDTDFCEDLGTLWTHISSLRKKIEPYRDRRVYLHTIRGVGYRLDVWPPPK